MNIQDCVPVYLQKPSRPIRAVYSHSNPASDFYLRGLIYIPDWSIYVNLFSLVNSQRRLISLQLLTQRPSKQTIALGPLGKQVKLIWNEDGMTLSVLYVLIAGKQPRFLLMLLGKE